MRAKILVAEDDESLTSFLPLCANISETTLGSVQTEQMS
jgi:hypothetical protein